MTEITNSYEVSPQQEQLWRSQPDGPAGRIQAVLTIEGALDASRLQAALARSVERHEILRTTFAQQPGIRVPFQVVSEELAPAWSTSDLTQLEPAEQSRRLHLLSAEERSEPLDYARGPLLRALLVQLGDAHHALLLTISSLCADASSATVLARELLAHYTDGQDLIEDPLQYADFAAWQRELLDASDGEALEADGFWANVKDARAPAIPFTGTAAAAPAPDRIELDLDDQLVGRLLDVAARYGASATSVVLAGWHAVLGRSAGEQHVTTGFLRCDRRHADLDGALGAFARPVPVSAGVGLHMTFAELLQELDHATAAAAVWQDYAPDGAGAPAIGFVCAKAFDARAGELRCSLDAVLIGGSDLGLWLTCMAGEGRLGLSMDYDPAYLDRDDAERLARRLECLLASVANGAGASIGELELLGDEERALMLREWGDGGKAVTAPCVHARFAAHAVSAPGRDAVIDEHGAITYGELERRANQLAHRLRRAGVGPDVAVGLCTDRSVDMVVGLLGIVKAGGAYVPLHYQHPPARLAHQLSSAGARVVVTQEPLLSHFPDPEGLAICLDRDRAELDREDSTALEAGVQSENLVYVIYTSGSTGTPKGVGVTHGNLANYASYITGRLGADLEPLSFGMATSISTDLANTSVFGALTSGGTLVLLSPLAATDPGAMVAQVERNPIDVLKITPSHVGALIAGAGAGVLPRTWLVIGGERAPWDLVSRVEAISDCRILNHYGPTEATVGCCTQLVGDGPGRYEPATVPIGRPIAGDFCWVLDEGRRPAALGAPGRLFVGGAGVAQGYVGEPELTAERFAEDPFASVPGGRMYDTGDLVRWLPNGMLEFLGRADEQVKIRGYRVEPAEVESALRAHPAVRDAVVLAQPAPAGDMRLIAYCASDSVEIGELKSHLAQWLPEFMIPSTIVALDSLPMSPSGKVDRLALPDPHELGDVGTSEYIEPHTPIEKAVAEIWTHVLGLERVGTEDDFFALGGHSLLATQVVAQVRSEFAVELPLHSLFVFPTVASLSAEIVTMMGDSEQEETSRLMAELEGLSDEEAERLLAGELQQPEA